MSARLTYGGLRINVVKTNAYERRAVFSESGDYLHTRYRISVRGTYNSGSQNDVIAGRPIPVPTPAPLPDPARDAPVVGGEGPFTSERIEMHAGRAVGPAGAVSATNIQHAALQPRLTLTWELDGVLLLQSPLAGFVSDATGGPFPVSCDVVEISGSRTFAVDFVIETCVNENPRFSERPSPIVGHSYSMAQDIDSDFLLQRTITGKVIFDAALTRTKGVYSPEALDPDMFRGLVVHPLPSGWKRTLSHWDLNEAGTELSYVLTDAETVFQIYDPESAVSNLTCFHVIEGGIPALPQLQTVGAGLTRAGMGLRALGGAARWGGSVLAGIGALASAGGIGATLGDLGAWVGGGAHREGQWADWTSAWGLFSGGQLSGLAQWGTGTTHSIAIEISGNRRVRKTYLEGIARALMRSRLDNALSGFGGAYRVGWRTEMNATETALRATTTWRGGAYAGENGRDPLPHWWHTSKAFPDYTNPDETTPPVIIRGGEHNTLRDREGVSAGRGTSLVKLAVAALTSPGDARNTRPEVPRDFDPTPVAGFRAIAPGWPSVAPKGAD